MTISSDDYALLSQDSYEDRKQNQKVTLGGIVYKVLSHSSDPVTGYQGTAYARVDTGEIIIAHRGTEQIGRDGVLTDGGMVFTGVNLQTADAMAFTKKVIEDAKREAEKSALPLNITVTGHSLGGTLAEITAYKYGLHGETFNAYGAVDLLQGIPEGGSQVIDHVRATDVVSAASRHFGTVHTYAAPEDIEHLHMAGYRDDGGLLTPRNPVGAIDLGAHSIDNFVPDSKTLGHSIINPESEARYRAHHGMIDRYRNDVMDLRTGLSASWEIPKVAVETGAALGRVAAHEIKQDVHAVEHGAQYVAHEAVQGMHAIERGAQHAAQAVEHTARSVAHTVHDNVLQGIHATERALSQGAHAVEHGAQHVAHEVTQGARAVEHGVQHAAQAVEHAAENVAHTVGENVSRGVHAAEHAAQSLATEASQAFDTLRHPGSWFDNKPTPAAGPQRLDHTTHPDHPLYQQTRDAVHRLDAEHHRTPDQLSDNLAAALVVAARRDGMQVVNHVVLSNDAARTFAVQGELNSSFKQITHVETAKASNTSIEQSSAAWQSTMQEKQSDPAHAPQIAQEERGQQSPHPAMGL
ncbi:XVIPCD domain-containing protein [Rhodanobacter sp. Col0626]|uniref:XVIPCD domain-containing protein n=1 Tax=Rhodanobacter sp. Col0626 TaxID=3415679 RepID=UPI003CF80787